MNAYHHYHNLMNSYTKHSSITRISVFSVRHRHATHGQPEIQRTPGGAKNFTARDPTSTDALDFRLPIKRGPIIPQKTAKGRH